MKTQKNYLAVILLLAIFLSFQGCVQKNIDGTYPSKYGYHSYNKIKYTNNSKLRNNNKSINRRPAMGNINPTKMALNRKDKRDIRTNNPYNKYNFERLSTRIGQPQSNFVVANQIEKIARTHLGKVYVWAANGPETFDCSGFTKSVFEANGIILPRRAIQQSTVGQYVTRENLQKGDLIFFDSRKSPEIRHVGIYLGEGKFIHASSAEHHVVIGTIDSGYHHNHFKWGRRLAQSSNPMYATK